MVHLLVTGGNLSVIGTAKTNGVFSSWLICSFSLIWSVAGGNCTGRTSKNLIHIL